MIFLDAERRKIYSLIRYPVVVYSSIYSNIQKELPKEKLHFCIPKIFNNIFK